MPNWKKVITSGSDASLNSLTVINGITGSLFGSASYALTASYAPNLVISGSINNVDYIDFNTGSAVPAWKSGRIFFDNTEGCLSVYNAEADITLQVGQENWTRVFNDTGVTIANGAAVRIIGTHGDHPEIVLAQSIQVSGSSNLINQVLGIATHTIEDGTFGYITTQGLVRGLNTSAYIDGATLYVSSSAGLLTSTPPDAPYEIIPVAQVVKAGPGGSGILYVAVQQPLDFGDLSSVLVTGSYTDGDLWTYNGPTKTWRHTNQLSGSYGVTGSWAATSFTGSLQGTASLVSSIANLISNNVNDYVLTSRGGDSINGEANLTFNGSTLNVLGNTLISGSLAVGTSSLGASENTITLGARDNASEGGQIGFNAPGGTYTSASFIDNWQNKARILKGNNTTSTGLIAQWDIHTTQMQLAGYTAASSFPGTATANLAVDSGGNVITVSTSGGTVFPYTGNAVITGSLTTTGVIYAQPNGGMYFQGGDDAALYDINVVNTMGVYGVQDSTVGSIKLGSGGGILSGKSGNIGIGTINPTSASLTVNGNVWASSFTGSILGTASTASYVITAQTASYVVTAQTASYVLQAVSASFATTASYAARALSSSFSSTSSYASTYAAVFPYTGSAIITGSLKVIGDTTITGSIAVSGSTTHQIIGNTNLTTPATAGGTVNIVSLNNTPTLTFSQAGTATRLQITVVGGSQEQTHFKSYVSTGEFNWLNNTSNYLARLTSNGNLILSNSGSTVQPVDAGYKLDISGSARIKGYANTSISSSLVVLGSGSAQPIFTVQGSQGELFSVTDSLSGSLFSVNDISGLPILEAFSDNTVLLGSYQAPALLTTNKVVLTASGNFTLSTLPTASYDGAFYDYTARSGSNARAGSIMAIWSGSSVNFTETTTTDFGTTAGLNLGVFVIGGNMVLTGSASTTAWTVKTIIRSI